MIGEKVTSIVTDNGSNFVKAFKIFGKTHVHIENNDFGAENVSDAFDYISVYENEDEAATDSLPSIFDVLADEQIKDSVTLIQETTVLEAEGISRIKLEEER